MSGSPSHGGTVFQPLEEDDPRAVAGYRLAAKLGAGGMGKVYLSYTPGGRPVAIKVIRPDFAQDAEFRRRFAQEVQSAQRVQGLYTAPVIDADTDARQPWLATAYVPGPSLADAVVAHGRLPVETVLLLVAGIAEALQVIHGAGIVHRDLKPANVLLAADGPRVIDFGIARAADATSLTGSGVTIGTPSFMSPEQAAGRKVDAATDVFALGQVAAYAAKGSPAFGEGTSHGVLYRIVHEEPDLQGVPERLRELVTRCLTKDPAERPSVADVLALCQAANDQTALRRPEEWLPGAVAADITTRTAAPAPATATTPPPPAAAPAAALTHPPTAPAGPAAPPQGFGPPPTMGQVPAHAHTPPPLHPHAPAPVPPHTQGPVPHPYTHPVQQGVPPYGPHTGGVPVQPAAPRRRSRAGLIAVAAALVFAVAGGGTAYVLLGGGDKDGAKTNEARQDPSKGTGGGDTADDAPATGGTGDGAPADRKSPPAQPPKAPEPVDYKNVDLTSGYEISLADDPVKPKEGSSAYDLHYSVGLSANDGARLVLLRNGQDATLETCTSETRFATYISKSKLSKGSQLCLQTSAGDVALLTIQGFPPESDPSDYISLDLRVWRGAMDAEETG
ncbi:serine/threonine-protein kinase [Streptomyces sp. SP18CS02]|uniref:serine/threonine-protein kinase n=1 Tax=Streptomyces sp. SP18CS02 TaxID=3002531 RepID=UPI002E76FB43|nr:serine/threonine-protein kinase [Streptomyces sp. SP18CS02]MEE1753838.1 serine/threonine-protein kinase [Streptomyces sp. SP18CS02]